MLMLDPSSDSRDCSNLAGHLFGRALDGSFLKQFALPRVLGQRRGALELSARLRGPAELPQEVAADGRQKVVRLERRLRNERVHKVKSGSGTKSHPHGDGPVQLDHRRRGELRDRVVERRNARPVGLGCGRRSSMARGNRRLQSVWAHGVPELLGTLERRQAAANEQAIPARPVLIKQEDRLPGRSNTSAQS